MINRFTLTMLGEKDVCPDLEFDQSLHSNYACWRQLFRKLIPRNIDLTVTFWQRLSAIGSYRAVLPKRVAVKACRGRVCLWLPIPTEFRSGNAWDGQTLIGLIDV
ncbi:hypothetical protein RRG08_020632 [Elysia crispata]|uniref:Uncharacterized protein n=1 Tax=Elysia crispata TaxID=231223 RepID=A0AAE1AD78_9GAST|nr:hypothetical protein RRG08_020632 [Elysia crispata]